MSNIAVIKDNLPAKRTGKSRFAIKSDLVTASGFPVISIKGKEFARVEGGERNLIIDPATEEVATKLELVVVNYNAAVSKVYYEKGYVEGSADKPTCYSETGTKPEADAERPQAKSCATCKHNQWGSRITESGAKAKSCQDTRRLAVTTGDNFDDPMLLRVPATSIKNLGAYQKTLFQRDYAIQEVVTRVGFQAGEAYPQLTFKAVGLLDDESLDAVEKVMESDLVMDIIGLSPKVEVAPEPAQDEEEEEELPVVNKTGAKAKAKAKVEVEEEEEEEEEPAPPKTKAKAKAKVKVEDDDDGVIDIDGDINAALADILG